MAYSSTPSSFIVGARPVRIHRIRRRGAHPSLPDLEPAEAAAGPRGARLRRDIAAQFAELRGNPDAKNALSRVSTYALNAVLLAVAFPIGFAMLMFNLLLGENLKATVHVLALTGLAVTVSSSEALSRILGIG